MAVAPHLRIERSWLGEGLATVAGADEVGGEDLLPPFSAVGHDFDAVVPLFKGAFHHVRKGWIVLASDAAHLYANIERALPFPIVYNVAEMLEGHRTLLGLADGEIARVIPGHDPIVMERFPAARVGLDDMVVRLD